jgi:HEAT repeat protein
VSKQTLSGGFELSWQETAARDVRFCGSTHTMKQQGLETTLETLAATDNELAVAVLLSALDLPQPAVREGAMRSLLMRQSNVAAGEILRRWDHLSERWKQQIAQRGDWLAGAIRKALLDVHDDLHRIGCEAAVQTNDYDVIPLLVTAATEGATTHADRAASTVLQLAELLAEELAAPRDYRIRRDPQLQRAHVLVSLEKAAVSYPQHGRRELLEAFLLLANRENAALKRVLQSPGDAIFSPLADVLANSSRPGVERLLLSYLDDPFAPLAALQVMVRRRDVVFLRRLLRKIGGEPAPVVRKNMKRIDTIPWMQVNLSLLDALGEHDQPGAVQLAAHSGIPRQLAFEAIAYLLRHGTLAGRRSAAQALAAFRGAAADDLIVRMLDDEDPHVRAAAASQLRPRDIPGGVERLLRLLDSTHQIEREAAQAGLEEFQFDRYLANFDSLAPDARRRTGLLVKQIDPQYAAGLRHELTATTRGRRKRALELIVAMQATAELENEVAHLLQDDDQYLRVEAIRVLATTDTPRIRGALRDSLVDAHPLVQEAAEAALARLVRSDDVDTEPRLSGLHQPLSANSIVIH